MHFGLAKRYYLKCFKYSLSVITTVSFFMVPQSSASAAPTIPPYIYISTEAGGNSIASRTTVDAQDDDWRTDAAAAGATSFTMVDFGNETDDGEEDLRPDTPLTTNPLSIPDGFFVDFPTVGGISLTVSLLNMDGSGQFGGSSAGMTVTYPRLARSETLQDNAPRPQSMYTSSSDTRPRFWNESIGSNSNRNAVLFQFSEPVAAFGAWFGDVETRTDGSGTPARVQLFDAVNTIIADEIIPTSTTDQSLCGNPPTGNTYAGCGNRTTRWVGFINSDVIVSAMLVIVGDDDTGEGYDLGNEESISFIGATLAEGITAPLPEPVLEPEPEKLPETGFRPGTYSTRNREKRTSFTQENDIILNVPALDLTAQIVGVPKTNQNWDVEWLGDQVGYLEGTSYPTRSGNTVLTGHVYDHFGLPGVFAGLKDLVYGERLVISAWGQDYIYEVRESRLTAPDDVSVLTEHDDGYDWITLLTCSGYDERNDAYQWRYIVKAVLVKVHPN